MEIGLCAQNVLTVLSSIVNINWGVNVIIKEEWES